jgi:hypothetical protein
MCVCIYRNKMRVSVLELQKNKFQHLNNVQYYQYCCIVHSVCIWKQVSGNKALHFVMDSFCYLDLTDSNEHITDFITFLYGTLYL